MLTLRDYQNETLEALRQGFADGSRAQILYAPTGAGKTEMAIALLSAVLSKGNRAAMILDRVILCDQTSQRLQKYQINHGVLQAGHWRYRPSEHIQVCSAQTLERRGSFPGLNLMIVDECHAMRGQTIEFIKNNPSVRVVGLTATPFTKGLGRTYDNVISTVTTAQLVEKKVLVPLRVFIAKQIDMTGAKKVAGEWSQVEASTRGKVITGDIVQEWVSKTAEIFGGPRKTIVFCSGVNHGAHLASKFAEQGFNFIAISYRDDDDYKRQVIEEFSKPDTNIHGLIATDVLTKGFDVPDVMVGISARPFSKSLSSHIQQMGRVMRGYEGKEFALWLDHSGNYLRFQEDWDDIYQNGVSKLDDGREKPKQEPTEKEKKESQCPACHALWDPKSDICAHCGYVRPRKSLVVEVPGQMEELRSRQIGQLSKQDWWSMLYHNVVYKGWSRGRASHTFKEKFGHWPNGLQDKPVTPNKEVDGFIKHRLIKYLRSKR